MNIHKKFLNYKLILDNYFHTNFASERYWNTNTIESKICKENNFETIKWSHMYIWDKKTILCKI